MGDSKSIKLREIIRKGSWTKEEMLFLIQTSYKKLKSSIYYDSSNMFLREKLAEFEADPENEEIDLKLRKLRDKLMSCNESELTEFICSNIGYNCVPKKVSEKTENSSKVITNHLNTDNYQVTKLSFFIDMRIEGHILGVLWILLAGKQLEKEYIGNSYANILEEGFDLSYIKLFKPYYHQYTKWRDNAVKTVENLVDSGKEALLISLDIKEYYYNANISFEKLKSSLNISDDFISSRQLEDMCEINTVKILLTKLIENIFKKYNSVVFCNEQKTLIPIGFLPSTIIGNWYLNRFDERIKSRLQPLYYGRYVDDLLFVIHKQDDKIYKSNSEIMEEYFVKQGILVKGIIRSNEADKASMFIRIDNNMNIDLINNVFSKNNKKKYSEFDKRFNDSLKEFMKSNPNISNNFKSENTNKPYANKGSFTDKFISDYKLLMNDDVNKMSDQIAKFISSEINSKEIDAKEFYSIELDNNNLYIQEEKIRIYSLTHKGSSAIINNFKRELQENASVFRFLPEKSEVVESFDNEIYEIEYSGSVNKIGSIDGFKLNKYNLSKYLARIIYSDKYDDEKYMLDTNRQLLSLFDNNYCIELYSLWEKVFVYFLVNQDKNTAVLFLKNIIKSMEKSSLKLDNYQTYKLKDSNNKLENKLNQDLIVHLKIVMGMIYALDNGFWNSKIDNYDYIINNLFYDIKEEKITSSLRMHFKYIKKSAIMLKSSNMFRHSYVIDPLLNYTNMIQDNDSMKVLGLKSLNITNANGNSDKEYRGFKCNFNNTSFIRTTYGNESYNLNKICNVDKNINSNADTNKCKMNTKCPFAINEKAIKYSPRFVHLHECILYYLNLKVAQGELIEGMSYLIDAHNLFNRINFNTSFTDEIDECYYSDFNQLEGYVSNKHYDFLEASHYFAKYPFDKDDYLINQKDYHINFINVGKNVKKKKLKIALVHMEIKAEDINDSFLNKPNLNSRRLENLYRLLNESNRQNADVIVFPEVSIPYYWLSAIANYSRQHNIAIICGLEHIVYDNNVIYNYMATILPCREKYSSSIIKLRLKNHYSPREKKFVSGFIRKEPSIKIQKEYDLFTWNGVNFSVYNCFELANIKDRSLFMSHVDMLVGLVHNKDINYYSSIIDSLSRDIHCYFVQVNNSRYGDTRITKPSSTATRNIVQVTGGNVDTVLIADVDIDKLRRFQILGYELQFDSHEFKPTPPEFNHRNVKVRMRLPLP